MIFERFTLQQRITYFFIALNCFNSLQEIMIFRSGYVCWWTNGIPICGRLFYLTQSPSLSFYFSGFSLFIVTMKMAMGLLISIYWIYQFLLQTKEITCCRLCTRDFLEGTLRVVSNIKYLVLQFALFRYQCIESEGMVVCCSELRE